MPTDRAELEVLRDLADRVIGFGDDEYTVMPWIDAHRLHVGKGEPYIGCPFCRDQFVSTAVLRAWIEEQREWNATDLDETRDVVLAGADGFDDALNDLSSFLDGLDATGGDR